MSKKPTARGLGNPNNGLFGRKGLTPGFEVRNFFEIRMLQRTNNRKASSRASRRPTIALRRAAACDARRSFPGDHEAAH